MLSQMRRKSSANAMQNHSTGTQKQVRRRSRRRFVEGQAPGPDENRILSLGPLMEDATGPSKRALISCLGGQICSLGQGWQGATFCEGLWVRPKPSKRTKRAIKKGPKLVAMGATLHGLEKVTRQGFGYQTKQDDVAAAHKSTVKNSSLCEARSARI